MYQGNLIHEDRPQIDVWLKLILGLVIALTLFLGLWLSRIDRTGAFFMFGITLFDALLFYCVIPRIYQIYSDRLKIVLGGPFSMVLLFKDIRSVNRVEGSNAAASTGIRFATSSKYVLEIARKGKLSVIVSPAQGEIFLDQLNQALKQYTSLSR
jgi:hypothetical protein